MKNVPLVSDLELAILGLLREKAHSGYALRKALVAFGFSDSPGAAYPALARLKSAGLIDDSAGFRVTAAGRRALRAALSVPLEDDEVARGSERVTLRLRFISQLGRAARARFLTDYARICAARAAELKSEKGLLAAHDAAAFGARSRWAVRAAKTLTG